jgi:hypothetical protein
MHTVWGRRNLMRRVIPLIAAAMFLGCAEKEPPIDIWTAAATGSKGVIEQHVVFGTDLDGREPAGGSSPLIVAAVFGRTEAARLLVENGASLDQPNNDGSTPLHVAAFFCHLETVQLLLEQGADIEVRNSYGKTALESVSGEWSSALEGAYTMIGEMWKLDLDLERIREARPQVADLIRRHAGG